MTTTQQSPLPSLALLLARVLVGVVLLAHGLPKIDQGVSATAGDFAAMGVPFPEAGALFAIVAEVGGGALLLLGALTPVAGALVAAQMAGAFWFAHRGLEPLVAEGGWELVAVIGALGLVLAVVGPGQYAVDHAVLGRRARRPA